MTSDEEDPDHEVEKILDQARESLSSFCVQECRAYCCRKGYLTITPQQAELLLHHRMQEFKDLRLLKKMSDGNWSLYLNKTGCPKLSGSRCSIHKHPSRPDKCRIFPIDVKDGVVRVSKRCPAGKNEMLYPYVARLVLLGCKVKK